MCIHHQPIIHTLKPALPCRQSQKPVCERDKLFHPVLAHDVDCFSRPVKYGFDGDGLHFRLVDKPVDGHDVIVPFLSEECGELIVDVQATLGVEVAVGTVQPAYCSLATAVVPAVLTTGHGVEIEVYP